MTGFPVPRVVLFDRDGTLVVDVPYNGDPELVQPIAGARGAVERARGSGAAVGVITNQSGVARGLITERQMHDTNDRVDATVGPFDAWFVCPHGADDGCRCRKPRPGMVLDAAERFGVPASAVAVIGDIGADVGAARAAGAIGVLVPTPVTRREEVDAADLVADDLAGALDLLFGPVPAGPLTIDGTTA